MGWIPSFRGVRGVMSENTGEVPVFACCSVGIGRWFWVAWESEADARALAPAVASGYEKSADRAESQAAQRLGPEAKRLPTKWASGYKRGGSAARSSDATGDEPARDEPRPRSRFARPVGPARKRIEPTRLAFLYGASERELADPLGPIAVTRHRIVKQNARKIHVDADPFDEDEWARQKEAAEGSAEPGPKPRTLLVDRQALRADGHFVCGRWASGPTFYASEEDGIRAVEAAIAAKHPWCATLRLRFPCSPATIRAAYRRLARTSHPDVGGDPAEFREVEQAYRAALAHFGAANP